MPGRSAQAAHLLNAAQRPVILAGGGARGCDAALTALAERLDAPVILTVNARGMLHAHPLGVPASPSLDAPRALIAQADQILALGTELGPTDYDMYVRGGFPDLSGMIRIDICPDQLARHPAALTIAADTGVSLAALFPQLSQKQADGAARAATRPDGCPRRTGPSAPLHARPTGDGRGDPHRHAGCPDHR